jgi:hypothetical protein
MRAKDTSASQVLIISISRAGTPRGPRIVVLPPTPFPAHRPSRPVRPVRSMTSPTTEFPTIGAVVGVADESGGASVIFDNLSTCEARTALSNGETIFVGLDLDNAFSAGTPLTANFIGNTGLVEGAGDVDPFVHISYVIDISGSTTTDCDGTRTILQCETDAIQTLDSMLVAAGVTVDISLTSFASDYFPADLDPATPGVQLLAPPGDPALFDALSGLRSAGGTAYKNSTRAAIDAITLSVKNPAVTQTIIVFLSDGSENNPANLVPEITALNALGTTVYTFAVGAGLECQGNLLALARDTGGSCTEVSGAFALTGALQDIVIPNRELGTTQITLNSAPLPISASPPIPTDGQPVGDGPFDISTAGDVTLVAGPYIVCLSSTTDGRDEVASCCVEFEVVE